jgi:hypothetical protein
MDTRDGRIYDHHQVAAMPALDRAFVREMVLDPTPGQLASGHVARNHPCPCGSGRKFKLCCLVKPPASPAPPPARFEPQPLGPVPRFLMRDGWLPLAPPAIGPAEVLDAVEAMDSGQRARLAGLLGIEARHELLYLPVAAGGFLQPRHPPPSGGEAGR